MLLSMTKQSRSDLRPGDIVKHEDAPCEVLCVFPARSLIFIMNKRTLCASFVHPNEVDFVRRPEQSERNQK